VSAENIRVFKYKSRAKRVIFPNSRPGTESVNMMNSPRASFSGATHWPAAYFGRNSCHQLRNAKLAPDELPWADFDGYLVIFVETMARR